MLYLLSPFSLSSAAFLSDFKTLIFSLCTFSSKLLTNQRTFLPLSLMATEEKENPYEGLGTGGKFRKRPFRRTQTTPYDRPSTSLRNPTINNNNKGWFSKVVDPAHRLISYSAHSLFSSLFRKRLPPPQSNASSSGAEIEQDVGVSHQEEAVFVSNNLSGKQQGAIDNGESGAQISSSDGGRLTELEKLLGQKTFTRSEIDHLTALMRSRTVDAPIREEEKRTEVVPSEAILSSKLKDEGPKTPIVQNRVENRLALTPYVTSRVPSEDIASPAELAKAYMGSRPSKVGGQSPAAREGPAFLKSDDNLPLNSPIMSIVPRTVRHAGVHENGFANPRTRGRSAIYSMARTPYARIYPTSTLKGVGHAVEGEPSSSTQSTLDHGMLYGSKQGSVKRRSSALNNDVGSVGPIRRIRHKANLYSKGSSLPLSGSSLSISRSGLGVDVAQQPSSSMWNPIVLDEDKHSHMKLSEENLGDTRPSMSGPLPSKSSEMASKILQQLDKLVSPKEKSSESRLPTVNDNSSMKLSPSMLHGPALQSMEIVDSSKLLDTVKDDRFNFSPGNLSDSSEKLTSQIDKVENGSLKLFAPSGELFPVVTNAKSVDSSVIKSVSYPPQKKRAFHMSAHEDCLDLDDDAYPNGAVSSVFPVENEMTRPAAMVVKDTSGTEAVAQENTESLSVVMPSKSSIIGREAHVGTDDVTDGSRVVAKVDVSTSTTSSIPYQTSKPATADTQTSFGSRNPAPPNGSIAIPPVFGFVNKVAPPKELTNSGSVFGLEKVVSSKEFGADVPLVNFGSNGNADKVPQMPFTSSSVGGESTFPNFCVSSDSKLGTSISSATVASATDSMPKVRESSNDDTKTNIGSVGSPELPVSSATTTPLFTSTSASTFGQSNGSLATSTSLSSPFTSQNVFSSSSLAASSSNISATSTPAIIPSSNSSSSNSLVASSSSPAPSFKFGSSSVPSTDLPASSSSSEPLETKNINSNLSSTAFGSSSAAVGSTGSGLFGFSSSGMTTVTSQVQGSVIGSSNGSVLNAQASPASSGFATSTQTPSVPFGSSAPSLSFGLTGNTAFSSGNSLFPSATPATNAAFSFGSSSSPSSSAINIFNSGTTFGLGTSASSSAANSVSSNSGTNSAVFGSSSWQPSKSSPFGSTFNSSSSPSAFGLGTSASSSATNSVSSSSGTKSALFGSSSWQPSQSSPFGSTFNSSPSPSGFSFGTSASVPSSSPTMFSSTPQFSFTSAAATTSTQPAFGNPNSGFTFGSAPVNNDQMTMEDSMAEDTVQATPPAIPAFGQQPNPFGASAPSGVSPFQFGSQQNATLPNPSPFQASGSVEFSGGGGSFSLGTGGGDKSGRRIVKVKNRQRKR
ncbi:PREDICTED: nuclear pore complex protein NUP1-like isoform X2 [Lupinus angustifolius]|uniref:nuclear pore complex protein NUP1-like isoform X2 n=1 Tax=Lupinus angustifolius TaxID=3871 RepID=UPI00092E225E|nr:PREDICTED: nuclear pore complex protein NUP1-like isoform X2 [Lupinus angustifolius]